MAYNIIIIFGAGGTIDDVQNAHLPSIPYSIPTKGPVTWSMCSVYSNSFYKVVLHSVDFDIVCLYFPDKSTLCKESIRQFLAQCRF